MIDGEKCLEVRMLGEFAMFYGGELVEVSKIQTSRTMHLLQILLYAGEKGIPRQKLMKHLFEREPVGDLSGNLRVTTHNLRKMLKNTQLPEEPYIYTNNQHYAVNVFRAFVERHPHIAATGVQPHAVGVGQQGGIHGLHGGNRLEQRRFFCLRPGGVVQRHGVGRHLHETNIAQVHIGRIENKKACRHQKKFP